MPLLQRTEPGSGVVSPVRAPVGLQLQSHTALWNGSPSDCLCISHSNAPPFPLPANGSVLSCRRGSANGHGILIVCGEGDGKTNRLTSELGAPPSVRQTQAQTRPEPKASYGQHTHTHLIMRL